MQRARTALHRSVRTPLPHAVCAFARRFLDYRGAASRAKAALEAAAAEGTREEYDTAVEAARSFNSPSSVLQAAAAAFQRREEDCTAAVARAEGKPLTLTLTCGPSVIL